MGTQPEILCVGHDPLLNRTRRLILQRRFTVNLASSVAEATAVLASQACDLVLLCYSMSDQECAAMVEYIHSLPVQTRILVLAEGRRDGLLLRPGDEEFVLGGPAELLGKAVSMVGLSASGEGERGVEKQATLSTDKESAPD